MRVPDRAPVGFIGIGTMGEPMAQRLLDAGTPLVVWNRTASRCDPLAARGAVIASESDDVFRRCNVVIVMLVDGAATDEVLGRRGDGFAARVRGRTLVNMATTEPRYSAALERDVRAAGGRYVEAPVSGSRKPAEAGRLVAVLDASPMASDVSRVKAAKLRARDFAAQAAISNVLPSTRFIVAAAREAGIASPLIDVCDALFDEARGLGYADADIVAVVRAIEERSERLR
jgi:3-hydroxyisobutyrate dehydrogenase